MTKRLVYVSLIMLNGALLWNGIAQYRRHAAQLQSSGLDGAAAIGLIIFGIFALVMPFHLRVRWGDLTPGGMVREFLVRGGMMVGVLTAVVLVIFLAVALITLPAQLGRGYLILPWLTILVPLVMIGIDLAQRTYARTLRNLAAGFALYSFRIYGMLAIQFSAVGIGFALGPAGVVLQIIGLVNLAALWGLERVGERPLLCTWAGVGDPFCTPLLLLFHLGHPLLLWLMLKYGERAFNAAADQYAMGLETIGGWLQK